MTRVLALIFTVFAFSTAFAATPSSETYMVIAEQLNVRLAPNKTGKVVAILKKGETVEVLGFDAHWARITPYYDGASEGLSGEVARWVSGRDYLLTKLTDTGQVEKKVPEEKEKEEVVKRVEKKIVNPALAEAIKSSDDLEQYQNRFMAISERLVNSGTCKLSDFEDIGGWWRSTDHKPSPVYYTYCGGGANSNRIFFNAESGKVFR